MSSRPMDANDDLLAALRDSVTIKSSSPSHLSSSNSSSSSLDNKMTSTRKGQQHTHQSASLSVPTGPRRTNSAAESPSGSGAAPPAHSRANSSNSIPSASNPFASPKEKKDAKDRKDKERKDKERRDKEKKGSRHADVIDKLDPSGFWGTGMLHHESAYDAAAPSRNKSSTAAPMRAFDANPGGTPTGAGGSSYPPSAPSSGTGAPKLSPLAQSTLREMNSITFEDKTPTATNGIGQPDDLGYFGEPGGSGSTPDSPSGRARKNSKDLKKTRSRSKERLPATEDDYMNARAKEQKNALANAWGVADPEPFEDYGFMAATEAPRGETGLASASSSIWNGQEGGYSAAPAGGPGGRRGLREVNIGEDYDGKGDDDEEILDSPIVSRPPVTNSNSGGVKRSKSLLQRIRHMRNNPNVPVAAHDQVPLPSPTSTGLPPSPGAQYGSMPNSASSTNFRSSSPSSKDLRSSSPSNNGIYSSSPPVDQRKGILSRGKPPPPPISGSRQDGAKGPSPPNSATSPNSNTSDDFVHIHPPPSNSRSNSHPPSSARDKSLPRIPLASPAEEDPFSDTPSASSKPPPALGRPVVTGRGNSANGRTPPPPPAPIPVPGHGGYFPRTRTLEEENGNGVNSGSGGAKLGRKGSLMKRVLGRG